MFSMYQKQQGFTLTELLIVVAILGILAAAAVMAYSGYVEGVKVKRAEHEMALLARGWQTMVRVENIDLKTGYRTLQDVKKYISKSSGDPLKDPWGTDYNIAGYAAVPPLFVSLSCKNGEIKKTFNYD